MKIYSNAKEVDLLVGGISQGKRADGTNCIFSWKDVQLKPGETRVEAKAGRNGKGLSNNCVWTLKPAQ